MKSTATSNHHLMQQETAQINTSSPGHLSQLRMTSTANLDTPTSFEQSRRQISSVVVAEEVLGPLPDANKITYIEVPVVKEVVRYVPKTSIVEVEKIVPKYEVEQVEHIVEVPQIEYIDRTVEKIIQHEAGTKNIKEIPREVVKTVPKIQYVQTGKVVEVEGDLIEIPIIQRDAAITGHPDFVPDKNVPVVVAQTVKPVLKQVYESNEKVDVYQYNPSVVPVDVLVAKPVPSQLIAVGAVSQDHRRVDVSAAQFNTVLKMLNEHLPQEDQASLPYQTDSEYGHVTFLHPTHTPAIVENPDLQVSVEEGVQFQQQQQQQERLATNSEQTWHSTAVRQTTQQKRMDSATYTQNEANTTYKPQQTQYSQFQGGTTTTTTTTNYLEPKTTHTKMYTTVSSNTMGREKSAQYPTVTQYTTTNAVLPSTKTTQSISTQYYPSGNATISTRYVSKGIVKEKDNFETAPAGGETENVEMQTFTATVAENTDVNANNMHSQQQKNIMRHVTTIEPATTTYYTTQKRYVTGAPKVRYVSSSYGNQSGSNTKITSQRQYTVDAYSPSGNAQIERYVTSASQAGLRDQSSTQVQQVERYSTVGSQQTQDMVNNSSSQNFELQRGSTALESSNTNAKNYIKGSSQSKETTIPLKKRLQCAC